MNVTIEHDSVDITTYIIEYNRNQQICTGIGTFDFLADRNISPGFSPWDTIILYEEENKKGTYLVIDSTLAADGKYQVNCQDYSKKVQDYFIGDLYEVVDHPNCRYWINRFLGGAGVSVSFTTEDTGGPLNPYSSLGMATAYEIIMGLLTQSGWYMYFDADGTAIIGEIPNTLASPNHTIAYNEIININSSLDDNMLRNRAVVWGATRPDTGEWIFADSSVTTEWDYDSNDKRTVVLANSNIYDIATAEDLANKMLDEFSEIITIKYLTLPGEYDITLGDTIKISAGIGSTSDEQGLITSVGSSLSSSGFTTIVIINERCPRLFGYFDEWDSVGYIPSGTTLKLTYSNTNDPPYSIYDNIDFSDPTLSIMRYNTPVSTFIPNQVGDLTSVLGRYGASPYDPAIYSFTGSYILTAPATYSTWARIINNAADTIYQGNQWEEVDGILYYGVDIINFITGLTSFVALNAFTLTYDASMREVYYYTYIGDVVTLEGKTSTTKYLDFGYGDVFYAKYGSYDYLVCVSTWVEINPTAVPLASYSSDYTTHNKGYLLTDIYNLTLDTHDLLLHEYTTEAENTLDNEYGLDIPINHSYVKVAVMDNFVVLSFGLYGTWTMWNETIEDAKTKFVSYIVNLANNVRSYAEFDCYQNSNNIGPYLDVTSCILYKKTGTSTIIACVTLNSPDDYLDYHESFSYMFTVTGIGEGEIAAESITEFAVQDQAAATFLCNNHKLLLAEHPIPVLNRMATTRGEEPAHYYVWEIDEIAKTADHIGYLDESVVGWDLPHPSPEPFVAYSPNISNRITHDTDSLFIWTGNESKLLRQITFSGGSLIPSVVDAPFTFLAGDFSQGNPSAPIALFGNTVRGRNTIVYTSGWITE